MIDLAVGTSSGGLTILAKFHQKWPISHCASIFETLARRCFLISGSVLGKLKAVVKYITSDTIYDERFLEGTLQENFPGHLFSYIPGTASGAKVALTTTSRGNEHSIFTNYNGSAQPTGYTVVRPEDNKNEASLWQAARATTAAPIYVHTSISIYCFSRLITNLVSLSLLRLTVKSIGIVGLGSPTPLN
ncbi:hypothetical protein N7449_004400 [Penicillium cf. viridicatum]|uniref:PNPLA domain-containing protein n=1 Tax=Penicillium cf. viridicatum TaxID=2972119 RepID=A0A9W9MJ64_9EURO|nr:hypothetical protein N7449_004400 [Penicillium cf. viridicatum]